MSHTIHTFNWPFLPIINSYEYVSPLRDYVLTCSQRGTMYVTCFICSLSYGQTKECSIINTWTFKLFRLEIGHKAIMTGGE